jgi:hypothetical protein
MDKQMMIDLKNKNLSEATLAVKYFNGSLSKLYSFRKENKLFKQKVLKVKVTIDMGVK